MFKVYYIYVFSRAVFDVLNKIWNDRRVFVIIGVVYEMLDFFSFFIYGVKCFILGYRILILFSLKCYINFFFNWL